MSPEAKLPDDETENKGVEKEVITGFSATLSILVLLLLLSVFAYRRQTEKARRNQTKAKGIVILTRTGEVSL